MDLELSADQEALVDLVRAIISGRFPLDRIRRAEGGRLVVDPDDWAALGEAGVFSLRLAEADGGAGLGLADAVLVFEELGRDLVPGPLVASHLASGRIPGAAEGSVIVGSISASGAPLLAEHLETLGALVVVSSAGSPTVVAGEALDAVRQNSTLVERSIDPLTPLTRLAALPSGTPLSPGSSGKGSGDGEHWVRDTRILTGALCIGIAAATCGMAVEYAKVRQQFGKTIGSFQAVKHLCADMLVRLEVARAAVRAAAVTADDPEVGDADRLAAGAALLAVEAALGNAKTSIQVHGGMGFTWDVPVHLYLMRARVLAQSLGNLDALAREVTDRLGESA